MLTASQIQEMVKGGEGYNVDFKRSVPSKVKEILIQQTSKSVRTIWKIVKTLINNELIEYKGSKKSWRLLYKNCILKLIVIWLRA